MKRNPERRAVSQTAIAREAGVARTTVSLALRGGDGLTQETIDRVMKAAERLGYRPNNLVHAIRSGRTRMVGVMVPPYDSYWADVLHGIHDALIARDYVPLALWPEHRKLLPDDEQELRQIQRLIDWRADGAILCPWFANLYQTHVSELKKRDLPMVTVDLMFPPSFHADAVLSDEIQGAAAIAEHIVSLGHREIVHFAGPSSESWSRERRAGFTEAMRGTPGLKLHFVELPLTQSRLPLIREAMAGLPDVTMAYCATDEIAEEVYGIAGEMGLRIPEDLSVIGYGNLDYGSRLNPPLTTVRQRPYRMGRAAANLVLDRIEAVEPLVAKVERLPVEFIPRASTAPLPK